MSVIPYIDDATLLLFKCKVEYLKIGVVRMALDTGATVTILSHDVLQNIGFQPDEMQDIVEFGDASQPHTVPKVIVPSFSIGDVTVADLEILCYTLPEKYGLNGLIGLNFLRRFKRFTVDFEKACLVLE
jgi:clan AA aspartic protease (TIGR02281 family)